jgi:glucans biosynthesis protein C
MNPQTSFLTPIRRNDIDWLRVLAIFTLILFQAARMTMPGMVTAPGGKGLSFDAPSLLFLTSQWYVPLAFLISGWSRKSPMQHLTGKGAVRERFFRLGLPFLTGVLVLCPLTRYLELGALRAAGPGSKDPPFPASFPAFLLDFFSRQDVFTWYDLWFLLYLFIFSVLSWPFFSWLLGKKVTPMKISPVWVYFPIIPLVLVQLAGDSLSQPGSYEGWTGSASFLAYFIMGFMISRYNAYERVMHHEAMRAGLLGVLLLGSLMALPAGMPIAVFRTVGAAGSWLVVVGILGLGKRYFEGSSGVLSYLRKATLPVFLLHQAPLVIFGTAIASSPVQGVLKLIVLLTLTLGTTMALYHFLIRKSSILGLLFGVKHEDEHPESWKDQAVHRDRG